MKTELELRHLRVFVAVVENGSHTRAARSLGLSQSTVSETLSALERTIGTALFRRGTKSPVLTPSGEALLPYARRILGLTRELMSELAKVSTQVSATLVVTAVESLTIYALPSRLAALRERWPHVRMEVITSTCPEIRDSVAAGKSDVGLLLESEPTAGDGMLLTSARLVIVAAPGHPLVGRPAVAEQLRRCEFYMCDASGNYHQVLRQYFEGAEFPVPRTQALGSVEGVKRGILAGGPALGLLPAHAVAQELRAGTLAEVEVVPALPALVVRAVVTPGAASSPVVEALLAQLRGAPLTAP